MPTEATDPIQQVHELFNETLIQRTLHRLKNMITWFNREPVLFYLPCVLSEK